jgi:hypothetical protein
MHVELAASLEPVTAAYLEWYVQIRRFFAKHAVPFEPIIKVESLWRLPLSAPSAREKLSGSAAALFQRFGYAAPCDCLRFALDRVLGASGAPTPG